MIKGYFNEDGIYTVEGTPKGAAEQERYQRMKSREGKTELQIAMEAAKITKWKRTQPVTTAGKAFQAAGLPWLEEDFKAEAEEKGIDVTDIPDYNPTMAPLDHAQKMKRDLNRVTGNIKELTQGQKRQLWNALQDSGFDPSQED